MGSVERAEEFSERLRRHTVQIEEEFIPDVVRKVAFDALNACLYYTPVDTGYAKNGWIISFDAPSSDVPPTGSVDKSPRASGPLEDDPGAAANRGRALLEKLPKYPHVFLSNNVPYIEVLDRGRFDGFGSFDTPFGEITNPNRGRRTGSIQAPNGILGPAFDEIVSDLNFTTEPLEA